MELRHSASMRLNHPVLSRWIMMLVFTGKSGQFLYTHSSKAAIQFVALAPLFSSPSSQIKSIAGNPSLAKSPTMMIPLPPGMGLAPTLGTYKRSITTFGSIVLFFILWSSCFSAIVSDFGGCAYAIIEPGKGLPLFTEAANANEQSHVASNSTTSWNANLALVLEVIILIIVIKNSELIVVGGFVGNNKPIANRVPSKNSFYTDWCQLHDGAFLAFSEDLVEIPRDGRQNRAAKE